MDNWNNNMNNQFNDNEDPNKNDKDKKKRTIRKSTGIALSAVLAGVIIFEGMNVLDDWGGSKVAVAAEQNNQEDRVELLKTKKEDKKDTEKTEEDSDKKSDDSAAKTDEKSDDKDSSEKVKGSLDVSDIAAEGMKSVVAINTKSVQEVQNYLSQFGFGGYTTQQEVEGSGSGIIVGKNDDELLIATNYHVISGADTVSVTCIDGQAYEASVKGYDEDKDLAVVSVKLSDISDDTMDQIQVATIGNSDDLKVGEQVIAIGNALGYGQSVTTGIVSAKNRKLDDNGQEDNDGDGVNLIQTDAAINPGNSGGALLNMNGEVVGINSAKLASTEVEGMGYAIAITDVSDILENLMNETPRDKVDNHGVLGITGEDVSDEASQKYGIPEGVHVVEVTKDGAADKAGIKENDIITEFDGKRVRTIQALVDKLNYYKPGEKVEVVVQVSDNGGYKEKKVTVELGKSTQTDDASAQSDAQTQEQAAPDDGQAIEGDDGSGDQGSILEEYGNGGDEDSATYDEFFGDIW